MGGGKEGDDIGKSSTEGGVAENIDGTETKCPVCSMSFFSKNAMYGHMRCHPERECWRGINPPPSAKIASCSSVSQEIDGLSHSSMTLTVVSSDTSPSQPPLHSYFCPYM
ncbi:hypothetical protein CK203_055284 [Vitis vinifera]|uniref:C2H2-type domain-containing protein n=1 Tax=Vitis vinifera TaxID=29760 RepID=A0A438GUZ8_VITVI|nr:hypothetical protein CK203_055284 [Vitis vinifera]